MMHNYLLLVVALQVCIVSYVACGPVGEDAWKQYKQQFNKQYDTPEDNHRQLVWEEAVKHINKHNSEAEMGLHSYTMGINSFSDLTHDEFRKTMKGLKISEVQLSSKQYVPTVEVSDLPATVNWTERGYVTEVGNQGQCGSCWAFSVLGALEGQWKAVHGKLVRLSVQDLMDCSRSVGNQGCSGGFIDKSYQFIQHNGGIDTWKSYPYTAKDQKCKFNNATVGATCAGFRNIKKGDETDMYKAVGSVGPVAVAVDATQFSFQSYKGGVYDEPKCSSSRVDHTLLVTGYGTYKGKQYWLAKNSWDTTWGMDGYIMMSRNKKNQCGIATLASYPIVK